MALGFFCTQLFSSSPESVQACEEGGTGCLFVCLFFSHAFHEFNRSKMQETDTLKSKTIQEYKVTTEEFTLFSRVQLK